MRTLPIKSTIFIIALIAPALFSVGQQLNSNRYINTEGSMYYYSNGNAFGRKVLGSLVFVGGAGACVLGVGFAVSGWNEVQDSYYMDLSDNDNWQAGKAIFVVGLLGMAVGVEMVKNGSLHISRSKVSLKLDCNAVGLVINF